MQLSDFKFDLSENLIANTPLSKRDDSLLMLLSRKNKSISHYQFNQIDDLLDPDSVIVMNDSRVIPARINLDFKKYNREILLVSEISQNYWECLVHPGRRMNEGKIINHDSGIKIEIKKVHKDGSREVFFHVDNESFTNWLYKNASIPQPHYIKEKLSDFTRYQTVYASTGQSVASPTAGLHFSNELLEKIRHKFETHTVRLDVGAGTFSPVKESDISKHKMHSEYFELKKETASALNKAKAEGKKIVAVGTTSMRVLESCTEKNILKAGSGKTDIFIYPGYKFKFVDHLITNFHTPCSSLLMLVSAFAGTDFIKRAYKEAMQKQYRFYSFGDAMLIK